MRKIFLSLIFILPVLGFSQSTLFGTWNNPSVGTLILQANGNGSLDGGAFTFTHTANKIIAFSDDGTFNYYYKFSNGNLVVSGGIFENPVTFRKAKTNTVNNSSKSGSIDKSIVGTWCWTNASATYTSSSSNTRCIVINSNGTYQYTYEGSISGSGGGYYGGSSSQNADQGSWKLHGNTISIVSQNEGAQTLSFQKKNHPKTGDPMIIIDGDAYVSYYQKNPW